MCKQDRKKKKETKDKLVRKVVNDYVNGVSNGSVNQMQFVWYHLLVIDICRRCKWPCHATHSHFEKIEKTREEKEKRKNNHAWCIDIGSGTICVINMKCQRKRTSLICKWWSSGSVCVSLSSMHFFFSSQDEWIAMLLRQLKKNKPISDLYYENNKPMFDFSFLWFCLIG